MSDQPTVPLAEMSAALDEVYVLRALLAHQSAQARGHAALASLSPKRRAALNKSAEVMALAAQGRSAEAVALVKGAGPFRSQEALRAVGANPGLTRHQFINETGREK